MKKPVKTLEDLDAEAAIFMKDLAPEESGATLISLSGELGAGKTAFTKAAAKILGVEELVNSPTFVLEKIYKFESPNSKFKRLVHIDAYRLESGGDLAPLGFDELMLDAGNLIFIEWPEKVKDSLPAPAKHIFFESLSDGSHTISYD